MRREKASRDNPGRDVTAIALRATWAGNGIAITFPSRDGGVSFTPTK
jgi:hypothetical protein